MEKELSPLVLHGLLIGHVLILAANHRLDISRVARPK